MNITRRSFLKAVAAGAVITATTGCSNLTVSSTKVPAVKKIVVLGGGFGGSTAAKYLKMLNPSLDVTLIDRFDAHTSCPLSNEVIFGLRDLSFITLPHKVIADKYGVNFMQAEVTGLDADKKMVHTSEGSIMYDKLIVSPGIGMDYDVENGFDSEMQKAIPHSWIAGAQTIQLRDKVQNLKKGSTLLLRIPKAIYRCPPGPYERASLMADFAKKNDCKLTVIDPNPGIVSKGPLFEAGFKELYGDVLTYIPSTTVQHYDKAKNTIVTDKGSFTADLINFIPDQKAGDMAFQLGLVPEGKKWAPVSPITFESDVFQDVYVIGDAIDPAITDTPKSGVIANTTAKLVAETIVREYAGLEPILPAMGNSCYSLVSPHEGIYIATVYHYDPAVKRIVVKNGANSIAKERSAENYNNLNSWAENILFDTFK
ncbi:MAG: FCSD flavin-binding domain-containing protein [Deferribacteraceae bacterium]|jgi:sulfide dehydrogenase [flavocytochrome c] flavoprotein subunit|nr:FCSD flavin-binding domain-containing protein [Deferribacteraceae bacterium]